MAITHSKYLIDDAKKICNRNNISFIENHIERTFIIDGKICLTIKEMLSEVYRIEAGK